MFTTTKIYFFLALVMLRTTDFLPSGSCILDALVLSSSSVTERKEPPNSLSVPIRHFDRAEAFVKELFHGSMEMDGGTFEVVAFIRVNL